MKKTALDGKQWILDILLKNKIDQFIGGKIYKDQRPADSTAEDIVINSLTITNDYLQNGVFNVNCYVPMLTIKVGDITQKRKNYPRLKAVADAVYQSLNDVWGEGFNLVVVNHQDLQEGDLNYYNFRIEINIYPIIND